MPTWVYFFTLLLTVFAILWQFLDFFIRGIRGFLTSRMYVYKWWGFFSDASTGRGFPRYDQKLIIGRKARVIGFLYITSSFVVVLLGYVILKSVTAD